MAKRNGFKEHPGGLTPRGMSTAWPSVVSGKNIVNGRDERPEIKRIRVRKSGDSVSQTKRVHGMVEHVVRYDCNDNRLFRGEL